MYKKNKTNRNGCDCEAIYVSVYNYIVPYFKFLVTDDKYSVCIPEFSGAS